MNEASKSPEDVVGLLQHGGAAGLANACAAASTWSKDGRFADLVALVHVLEQRRGAGDLAGLDTLVDHADGELSLCTAPGAVAAVLTRALELRGTRPRMIASRLGYGQTTAALLAALESASAEHREILACWMHEVVLRGTALTAEPVAVHFRAQLAEARHPLAVLPLALVDLEREVPSYMPLYGDAGLGRAIDTLTSGPMTARTVPPPADGDEIKPRRIDDPATIERLGAAVRPWTDGPSGKIEAHVFEIAPPISGHALGSWLVRSLALASVTAAPRVECMRTGPEGVFGPLFAAASNGGASTTGLGGAYGRLAAWTSLGALAAASGDLDAVATAARGCTYLTFRAPGPWFHDIAWDLGLLALRADGRSAAVLAATDAE